MILRAVRSAKKECDKMKLHRVDRTKSRGLLSDTSKSAKLVVIMDCRYDLWIENDVCGRTTTTVSSMAKIGVRLIAIGVAFACPRYCKPSRLSSLFDVHRRETISLATASLHRCLIDWRGHRSKVDVTRSRNLPQKTGANFRRRVSRACICAVCFPAPETATVKYEIMGLG